MKHNSKSTLDNSQNDVNHTCNNINTLTIHPFALFLQGLAGVIVFLKTDSYQL